MGGYDTQDVNMLSADRTPHCQANLKPEAWLDALVPSSARSERDRKSEGGIELDREI